jgi:hypothetical protein
LCRDLFEKSFFWRGDGIGPFTCLEFIDIEEVVGKGYRVVCGVGANLSNIGFGEIHLSGEYIEGFKREGL